MLGKFSSFVSYWKCLEVYLVKRFPSNKLPMFGMVFTYFTFFYFYSRFRSSREYLMNMKCLPGNENTWNFTEVEEVKKKGCRSF